MCLTNKQKKIVWAGISCLIILACWIPWTYTFYTSAIKMEKPAGYYCIFSQPAPEHNSIPNGVQVDVPRVVIPMFVVLCATIAGVVLTNDKPKN